VLRARLLGALEVELDGTGIDLSPSQRPWALFSYLALAARPVARSELASRFWPDVLDQSARASLRSALWALKRQLGEVVQVDGDRVRLVDAWVDAIEFERLAEADPSGALELCRGDLLEGLEDEWAVSARERHRERVMALLEQLASEASDPREAVALTRRQVELDPFDEDAHRRLMTRLAAGGDRAGALKAYRALGERLQRELRVAPSRATQTLAEQLRAGTPASGAAVGVSEASSRLPFVGRDHELAQLEAVWRGAVAGAGAVAAIRGEAGIGKTRLATELRERAAQDGALTAACAALDLGGAAPLSLWAELIRALLPALPAPPDDAVWPGDLAILAPGVPAHFTREPSPIAPDLQRTRLFEAVVALLAWAAQNAPLLLVLEDVHAADGPSLELAAYAARRLGELRAMVVVTRRELPHSPHADRLEHALRTRGVLACELELAPLTIGEGAALARAAAPVSDRDAQRIVERADGNPLLVVEAARALGSGAVTPTLRGSVRATLGELDRDSRRIVETAAVAARPVPVGPSAAEAATAALQSGLLIAIGETVGFRHALLREAVYGEIAEPRRRGLHHEWAKSLGAGEISRPAESARHFRLAGDDAAAVPQLLRAAADARAVGALEDAAAFLEEAISIAPDRADAWLELGELEAWRVRRERAEAAFDRALALLSERDPLEQARGHLRRARAYHGPICVPRAVLESSQRALELLDRSEQSAQSAQSAGSAGSAESADEERSEAVAARAWAEAVAGDIDEADRLLIELSHLAPADEALRRYDAGHARALALMRRGRFVDSYGPSIAAGEAIARAGRPDLAYGCWANAASAAAAAGEHDRALEFLDRGTDAVAGHGLQSLELHLLSQRTFVLRLLGKLDEARRAAGAEQAIAERLGQPELLAMASNDLGLVSLEAGDWSGAASLLADSLAVPDAPISRPLTRLALAEALARSGDPDGAAEQVRETVLEPVRPSDFPETLVPRLARVQALIALARGDRGEATRRIEEAIGGWERLFERTIRADSITSVLADLGRPVVGLVEPERELQRARSDLEAINALVS
jgi:DNA-binding SARP family transcriptional activator